MSICVLHFFLQLCLFVVLAGKDLKVEKEESLNVIVLNYFSMQF